MAIIVWHTHPGGGVEPSREDVEFTGRLQEACEAVGVMLVDHLILVGVGAWRSMRREGLFGSEQ